MIQGLQKRLQERERVIAQREQQIKIIASQLEDLKRIEQEHGERKCTRTDPDESRIRGAAAEEDGAKADRGGADRCPEVADAFARSAHGR